MYSVESKIDCEKLRRYVWSHKGRDDTGALDWSDGSWDNLSVHTSDCGVWDEEKIKQKDLRVSSEMDAWRYSERYFYR